MQAANGKESGGGIRHKLGSLFSPRGTPPVVRGREDVDHGIFITADVLRELEQGVPTQRRVRAMRELTAIVASKRLEEHAVEAIWKTVSDLLQPTQPTDVRHAVLHFAIAMVTGQYSELGSMRAQFLQFIQRHQLGEDTQQRLDMLVALTLGGKDIQYLEDNIGSFLVDWMPQATSLARAEDFLGLLVKLVHYNSAYLDEDVLSQLVSHTCSLASHSTISSETELCLSLLDAVICYSVFPTDTILTCITTLCHTLNIERFIQRSLEVMQRLLGTHLGHTVIYTMCSVLQDKASVNNVLLLRGAVFYISMSLWGVKKVDTLSLPFTAVLPAILQATLSGHTIVVYEVALSVLRLVRHYSSRLGEREWEMVHRILHSTQHHLTLTREDSAGQLQNTLQDVFCSIEQVWEGGHHSIGPAHLFFQLLDDSRATLPEQSVLHLVLYHTQVIDSTDLDWLQQITDFMDKFYRGERRAAVRREALRYLGQVMADHWLTQQNSLVNNVLLPFLKPLPLEMDSDLRCQAVQLLVQFLPSSSTGHALNMLALLTQVLDRGLQEGAESPLQEGAESRLPDCRAAVFGLTQLLREMVYRPGPLAGQVFAVLVQFLRQLYTSNHFTATSCVLRIHVFNCLLSMRADRSGQVGFYDKDSSDIRYSPFHVCTLDGGQRSMPFARTVLHMGGVFEAVTACLLKDVEWEAVFQLLHLLKDTLQCRPMTLSAMPDLSPLLPLLTSLTGSHSPRHSLFNTTPNVGEVTASVYPLLAILATYPAHLHRRAQHELVCCLEAGLVGKQTPICMSALTVCSLELQATMKRFLPRVLYRLGQVAATPSMATPTLEFLASLIPIPALVSGFVEEEYLSVFGIALPYPNPQRYSPYVVAMAHHVICMWFPRCRICYRPKVARFISKGLSVYVTEGGSSRERLCHDLTETTLDLLAHYTHSNISTLPSRSSGAEFLMSGGPSKTWALSNYLVTVTTAGEAGGKPGRCAQCLGTAPPSPPPKEEAGSLSAMSGLCSCWGWGWAEVKVRRPSGNTAWMLHLQNRVRREQPLTTVAGERVADSVGVKRNDREMGKSEDTVNEAENTPFEPERLVDVKRNDREMVDIRKSEDNENEADQLPWQQTPFPWKLIIEDDVLQPMSAPECDAVTDSPELSPTALDHMPPLLSYEEGPAAHSPSLHSSSLLTEQEQLHLVARVYRSSECESSSSDEEPATDWQSGATGDVGGVTEDVGGVTEDGGGATENITEDGGGATEEEVWRVEGGVTEDGGGVTADGGGVTEEEVRREAAEPPVVTAELPNDPSFVFLQLFHSSALSLPPTASHTPRLLPADEATSRAVKLLDLIPPYNTHKIGVVYVGLGQTSESAILANTSGSSGYQEFLSGLGQLRCLSDCPADMVYLGGLDRAGSDGEFTYIYHDDTTQVVFHVATLMPTLTSDPQCSNKKLHIGNDFVTLVYNESGQPYQFGTIKGQFGFAEVVIEPLPAAVNRVCVTVCPAMEGMLSVETAVCSSQQLPVLARTKALQANFVSLVHLSSESPSLTEHHPSNWLSRLRQIRNIRERCPTEPSDTHPDFTTYS